MALLTLDELKDFQGIPLSDSSDDAQLTALQGAAERVVKEWCHRDFELDTYLEYYSGTGTRFLALRQRPVHRVISLCVDHTGFYGARDGSFDASVTQLTEGVDYALQIDRRHNLSLSGVLVRIGTTWAEIGRVFRPGRLVGDTGPSLGSVRVEYVAGYDPVPEDLKYAVSALVSYMKRFINLGQNVTSEKLGDYGYHIARRAMRDVPELGETRQVLSRYREVAWGIQ